MNQEPDPATLRSFFNAGYLFARAEMGLEVNEVGWWDDDGNLAGENPFVRWGKLDGLTLPQLSERNREVLEAKRLTVHGAAPAPTTSERGERP